MQGNHDNRVLEPDDRATIAREGSTPAALKRRLSTEIIPSCACFCARGEQDHSDSVA